MNAFSEESNQLLYEAAQRGDRALAVALVERGANPNAEWHGRTLLTAAAATENYHMVDILLQIGADPNRAGQGNVTPLMLAAMTGNRGIVARLLRAGANVDSTRDTGSTALLEAIATGQPATAMKLLEAGADPNATNWEGVFPLGMTAHQNQADLARALIAFGADVNARSSSGGTALFEACVRGHIDVARTLLEAGADPTLGLLGTHDGRTPFVAAKHSRHDHVAALVEQYTNSPSVGPVFLSWTTRHPRDNAAMEMIKLALDQHHVGYFDYTRFQMDRSTDQSEAIRTLLEQKVRAAACSIEIISSEILPHEWVQFERQVLRDHRKARLFCCLEEHYMIAVADSAEFERLIIRLNMSDGLGGLPAALDGNGDDQAGYYRSVQFRADTLRLAQLVRQSIQTNDWGPVRNDPVFARCSADDQQSVESESAVSLDRTGDRLQVDPSRGNEMASPDYVVSLVDLDDLNSLYQILSDRQLTREEAFKVVAVYVALHPEAQTKRDTEYRVRFPSALIPAGHDFSASAFAALQADPPRPRTKKVTESGCTGVLAVCLLGSLVLSCWFYL